MTKEAKARLDELSSRITEAMARQAEQPDFALSLRRRSAKKSLSGFWRNIRRGYSGSVSALDAIEKSPIVRLIVGLVFLFTAAAVLLDLNDRSMQIEIAGWDLFEKTKPGTPQRTRAVNLLAETGASLAFVDFGLLNKQKTLKDLHKELSANLRDTNQLFGTGILNHRSRVEQACQRDTGYMHGVELTPKTKLSLLPPEIKTDIVDLQFADFSCLSLSGNFSSSELMRTKFLLGTISDTDFSDARFWGAMFDFAAISGNTSFLRASLDFVTFSEATIGAPIARPQRVGEPLDTVFETSFRNAKLKYVSFEGVLFLGADFTSATFEQVNISGSQFIDPDAIKGLTQKQMEDTWSWEDDLPKGLELFDPPLRVGNICKRGFDFATQTKSPFGMPGQCRNR